MKNNLSNLNEYLFKQLERLGDTELSGDRLGEEIDKARAVCEISGQIISNGSLLLKAQMAKDNSIGGRLVLPKVMED